MVKENIILKYNNAILVHNGNAFAHSTHICEQTVLICMLYHSLHDDGIKFVSRWIAKHVVCFWTCPIFICFLSNYDRYHQQQQVSMGVFHAISKSWVALHHGGFGSI